MKPTLQPPVHIWMPVWAFTLGLFLIAFILPLTREGMAWDGICYAAIAKNLSLGHGSLWKPFYTQITFPTFYEHPPLAIYFQSLFFKLFGQGFGVEQFYSFLMALGQFSLMAWYWVKKEGASFSGLAWLLLLWLLVPLNYLYLKNFLVGTLAFFTTLATMLLLNKAKSRPMFFMQYMAAAAAILIAFFCDGPTAFFPIAVPLVLALLGIQTSIKSGCLKMLCLISMLAGLFVGFFYLEPQALFNTKKYLDQQVLASIVGERDLLYTHFKHLSIVICYLRYYIGVSVFAVFIMAVACRINGSDFRKIFMAGIKDQTFLLFFVLSLISSLPVGISHRQATRYIMQSAPFFTLAMMKLSFESFQVILTYCVTKVSFFKKITYMSYVFFGICMVIVMSLAAGYNRDQTLIQDVDYLVRHVKTNSIISTYPSASTSYSDYGVFVDKLAMVQAHLARKSMILLSPEIGHHYFLSLKGDPIPAQYQLIPFPLSSFNLSEKMTL